MWTQNEQSQSLLLYPLLPLQWTSLVALVKFQGSLRLYLTLAGGALRSGIG